MLRPFLIAVLVAGCGSAVDDRPPTLEYVSQAIIAPACGNAECHSSFHTADGWRLDSVAAMRQSVSNGLITVRNAENPDDIESTLLLDVLTRTQKRMPYDQPLPEVDIDLIREWVATDKVVQ